MAVRTVLIGFAEALAGPESAFSLLDAGFRVVAFTRAGRRPALRHLGKVELYTIPPPEHNIDAAFKGLHRVVQDTRPDAILPLDDVSLWMIDRGRQENAQKGPPIAASTGRPADIALAKDQQLEVARDAGFAVPATVVIESRDDPVPDMRPPLVMKPANAVELRNGQLVKGRSWICSTHADLHRALDRWQGAGRYLLQPFIAGRGEGVFGFFADGVLHASSGHRRLRMMNPHGSGSSACRSQTPDEATLQRAERFLQAIGLRGIFMIELLRDKEDRLWFMELNGRPWGSMALARRLGFEYPAWAVHLALDPTFRPRIPEPQPAKTLRHLGRDIVHLLMVIRGPKSNACRENWPGRLASTISVLNPWSGDAFYNMRRGCNRLFLADTFDTILEAIRRNKS